MKDFYQKSEKNGFIRDFAEISIFLSFLRLMKDFNQKSEKNGFSHVFENIYIGFSHKNLVFYDKSR